MLNNHDLKMHALLWLMLLALCNCLVNGQESEFCDNRYLTINTYGNLNAVNVTCFASNGDCGIYSSPPGNGCSQDSLTQIGSVPAGKTTVITSNLLYGAALCSNYQTSVQLGDKLTPIVQLPRATQAGKLFHTAFRYQQNDRSFKCGISALAASANVQYSLTSTATDTEIVVKKYQTEDITFNVREDSPKVLKIISNAAVIVSCQEATNSEAQLIVLEPISSQPLMIVSPIDGYYSITIADCTTNDIILDSNRVDRFSFVYSVRAGDNSCRSSSVGENFYLTSDVCSIVIVPQDNNACISVLAYDFQFEPVAVGLSESKLTSRLVNYPYQQLQLYFAFSPTNCSSTYGSNVDELNLELLQGNQNNRVAGAFTGNFVDKYDSVECENPVYILFLGFDYVSFRSGFQSGALWEDFIESVECENVPIQPTPPSGPPTESPTESPISPARVMRPPFSIGLVSIFLGLCGYLLL